MSILCTIKNEIKNFKRSITGNANAGIIAIITLIVVVAVMGIGVIIQSSFQAALPTVSDPVANATATKVFETGWAAYDLASVIPMVVVAGAIISILIGAFAFLFMRSK
jgi:hypothetical protein